MKKILIILICLSGLSLAQPKLYFLNNSYFIADSTWDDLLVPLTTAKLGILSKPDFDYDNIGLLFPQNDSTEAISMIVQLPHGYKEGTDIRPHIHWQQSAATAVTWVLKYKWFNIGALVPASFTKITTSTGVETYTSGNLQQLSFFTAINGTGKTISSLLLLQLYRYDNVTTGDVLAFQFDLHYQKNSNGSSQLYTK